MVASIGLLPVSAATTLQLGNSEGTAGSIIEVPLRIDTSDVVSAAQIDLIIDPGTATIASVSSSDAGANHFVDSELLDNGNTRVVVYSFGMG